MNKTLNTGPPTVWPVWLECSVFRLHNLPTYSQASGFYSRHTSLQFSKCPWKLFPAGKPRKPLRPGIDQYVGILWTRRPLSPGVIHRELFLQVNIAGIYAQIFQIKVRKIHPSRVILHQRPMIRFSRAVVSRADSTNARRTRSSPSTERLSSSSASTQHRAKPSSRPPWWTAKFGPRGPGPLRCCQREGALAEAATRFSRLRRVSPDGTVGRHLHSRALRWRRSTRRSRRRWPWLVPEVKPSSQAM